MRAGLLTNSSTAAAKTVVNPTSTAITAGQASAQSLPPAEQARTEGVLGRDRGISAPEKRSEGAFDEQPLDQDKEGAALEASYKDEFRNTKRLLGVA